MICRLHRIKPLFLTLFAYWGETFKQINEASVYGKDTVPISACDNYRIRRSRRYRGKANRGYHASKRHDFCRLKLHLLVTAQAEPHQSGTRFVLTPGSCADVAGLDLFDFDRPPDSQVIGGKACIEYEREDVLKQAGLHLLPLRKTRGTRQVPPWLHYLQAHYWYRVGVVTPSHRKAGETAGSTLERLVPKSIHAVTAQGFELKVVLFIIALSFNRLPL